MQLSWTEQIKRSDADFVGQIDALTYYDVIWRLYIDALIAARAPQGLLSLCFRERQYWMTKTPLVCDMHVEEHHMHHMMRQFGLY
jgi:hypothetical protein